MAFAQRAIGAWPDSFQLSLRMYGALSAASQKNCRDTHVAVPFGPAGASSGPIATAVDAAKAQGFTPIAYSLEQAANDFPAGAKERVIVLVSDGKETCQGDPAVTAKALAAKGITVHTVGFVVDSAARGQLQAIARTTGGSYFDAPVGPELPDTLKSALNACKKTVVTLPPNPKPGKLRTTSATYTHDIVNAETGQKAAEFHRMRTEVELPAGIYEVKFGPATWKGIEVRSGETTTIEPGVLKVEVSNPGVFVKALLAATVVRHLLPLNAYERLPKRQTAQTRGPKEMGASPGGERRPSTAMAGKARVGTLAPAHPYNTRSLGRFRRIVRLSTATESADPDQCALGTRMLFGAFQE